MLINSDGLSLLGVSSRRFSRLSNQKVWATTRLQPSEVCVRFHKKVLKHTRSLQRLTIRVCHSNLKSYGQIQDCRWGTCKGAYPNIIPEVDWERKWPVEGSWKSEGYHMGGMSTKIFHFPRGLWHGVNQEKNKRNHGDMLREFQADIVPEVYPWG
jgi:hypothetical protein